MRDSYRARHGTCRIEYSNPRLHFPDFKSIRGRILGPTLTLRAGFDAVSLARDRGRVAIFRCNTANLQVSFRGLQTNPNRDVAP